MKYCSSAATPCYSLTVSEVQGLRRMHIDLGKAIHNSTSFMWSIRNKNLRHPQRLRPRVQHCKGCILNLSLCMYDRRARCQRLPKPAHLSMSKIGAASSLY